jgi:hypothetical protein
MIAVSNSGSGNLNWTVSHVSNWLVLSARSGSGPSTINASVNTAGLATGRYQDVFQFSASGASNSPLNFPVVLTVSASSGTPVLTVNPTTLNFSVPANGSSSQTLTVSNSGTGSLSWTGTSSYSFATVTPSSGGNGPTTVTVTVSGKGMTAGDSYGDIISFTDSANGQQYVTLSIQVTK